MLNNTLLSCIIPSKDEQRETICEAIINSLHNKANNLEDWITVSMSKYMVRIIAYHPAQKFTFSNLKGRFDFN